MILLGFKLLLVVSDRGCLQVAIKSSKLVILCAISGWPTPTQDAIKTEAVCKFIIPPGQQWGDFKHINMEIEQKLRVCTVVYSV